MGKITISTDSLEIAGKGSFEERALITNAAIIKNRIDKGEDINKLKELYKDNKEILDYIDQYLNLNSPIS